VSRCRVSALHAPLDGEVAVAAVVRPTAVRTMRDVCCGRVSGRATSPAAGLPGGGSGQSTARAPGIDPPPSDVARKSSALHESRRVRQRDLAERACAVAPRGIKCIPCAGRGVACGHP
jgi:hypothetical protein